MTRFSSMRPATLAGAFRASSCSFVFSPNFRWRSAARSLRRKSFGKAMPFARSVFSFSRRSSTSLLSSSMSAYPLAREVHDEPGGEVEPRLDARDEHVLVVGRVRAEAAQAKALDHRVLRLQRGERRVGASALGHGIGHELHAELLVDGLGVLGHGG